MLRALLRELVGYPHQSTQPRTHSVVELEPSSETYVGLIVRLRLVVNGTALLLFSASTVFGGPVDITLAELAIESFFPADLSTAEALRALAQTAP